MFEMIENELRTLSPYADIFMSNTAAYDFLRRCGVVKEHNPCPKCQTPLKIGNYSAFIDGLGYKCPERGCRKQISAKYNTPFSSLSLELKKILRCIYAFTINLHVYQAELMTEVSKPTFLKIRDMILSRIENFQEEDVVLGGDGVRVNLMRLQYAMDSLFKIHQIQRMKPIIILFSG
jgi:transposase-like protein